MDRGTHLRKKPVEKVIGLQWGRDPWIAELASVDLLRTKHVALQWGRDPWIAELG